MILSQAVAIALSIAMLIFTFYQMAKSLHYLGVAQHFDPGATAFMAIVPLANLYFPWAGLSEVRNTFTAAVQNSSIPPKGIRGFNTFTFIYGLFTFLTFGAVKVIGGQATQLAKSPATDLQSFNDFFSQLIKIGAASTLNGLIFLTVLSWYWFSMLGLYDRCRQLKQRDRDRNAMSQSEPLAVAVTPPYGPFGEDNRQGSLAV
jgi:hypothetical protein